MGIHNDVKAKVFDMVLQNLPPGKSPASYLEEQFNGFFKQNQAIRVVSTHMNTLILPPKPAASDESKSAESIVIIFSTLFYE